MPIHEITPQRIHHHEHHAVERRILSCVRLIPSSKTRQDRLIREEPRSEDQDRDGEQEVRERQAELAHSA